MDERQAEQFWQPGSFVLLKQPYKPSLGRERIMPRLMAWTRGAGVQQGRSDYEVWRDWEGFTQGVIVRRLHQNAVGERRVALILYDPQRSFLYVERADGLPTFVDYSESDLIPYKSGAEGGYRLVEE